MSLPSAVLPSTLPVDHRYIPQSPKPHSPPETPSPASPGKVTDQPSNPAQGELGLFGQPHQTLQDAPLASRPTLANLSSPQPDGELAGFVRTIMDQNTAEVALQHTPENYSYASSAVGLDTVDTLPTQPLSAGSRIDKTTSAMSRQYSGPNALGDQYNPTQPAPESLTIPVPLSDAGSPIPPRSSSPTYLKPLSPNSPNASFPRPRSTSPTHSLDRPYQAFASSSSMNLTNPNPEQRETPTRLSAFLDTTPSPSDSPYSNGLDSPYSPAADGKKEPSIKFAPYAALLDGNAYETNYTTASQRNRMPLPPGYQQYPYNFPLSGREVNVVTQHGAGKEKFTESAVWWLGMYFFLNMGLTLFNKMVLVSFPFPYTLTGLHALSGCAGCYFSLERGAFVPARLTQKENLILAAFSVLYTINIAVSNISLRLVTLPFHQVVRASTPLFTIFISAILLRTRASTMKIISLLPVIVGVGFATYGDYYFTVWGLILTLLGTFLAAMKTVVTNLIQTGGGGRLKLHPLDLLMRMSPLSFIQCVIYGWYTGELEKVRRYGATQMTQTKAIALLINGIIACGLNIVSFTANKKAGALTMTVSANCKQVLTIALAVFFFDSHINFMNAIGIILTLIGGGWYGYVEYLEKNRKKVGKILEKS